MNKKRTLREALEEIAMLKLTSSGTNESSAISIAREALGIDGEDFQSYKETKPLGINSLLMMKMSKKHTTSFWQDVNDLNLEIEARLLPDDIETRKQYLENLDEILKELSESLSTKKKINPENIAILLTAIGTSVFSTNAVI